MDRNTQLRVSVATSATPSGEDAYVTLRLEDHTSGTVLADLRIDPATWWMLLQGRSEVLPGFVGPNLDRVGKRMENARVTLPEPVEGDTPADLLRDVHRAVAAQLPEDWQARRRGWDTFDAPRVDNKRQRYTIVRRWVEVA